MKAILVFYGALISIGIIGLFFIGVNPFSILLSVVGGLGAATSQSPEATGKKVGTGVGGFAKGMFWDAPASAAPRATKGQQDWMYARKNQVGGTYDKYKRW